jgi:hypothetical protein
MVSTLDPLVSAFLTLRKVLKSVSQPCSSVAGGAPRHYIRRGASRYPSFQSAKFLTVPENIVAFSVVLKECFTML